MKNIPSIVKELREEEQKNPNLKTEFNQAKIINENLKDILNQMPYFILLIDENFIIHFANNYVLKLLDLKNDQIIGKKRNKIVHGCNKDKSKCPFTDLKITKKQIFDEKNKKWFNVNIVPTNYFTNDKKRLFLHTFYDISDLKFSEREILESTENFNSLFDMVSDGIYFIDFKGKIIDGNKKVEELTGYKKEELVGKNIQNLSLMSKNDISKAMKGILKCVMGFSTGPHEYIFNRKDGSKKTVEISVKPVKMNNRKVIMGVVRDISKRKEIKTSIIIKESAIKHSINAIAIIDNYGKITYANESFLNAWNYKEEEVIGEPIVKFWKTKGKYAEILNNVLEKGGWQGEFVAERKDGSIFNVFLSASSVLDDTNNPIAMLTSFIDITEQKKSREKLELYKNKIEKQNIQLKKLDQLKSAFLNATSHELRTPMSSIKGYVQMLIKQVLGELSKEQKDALEVILRNTNRLDNLIQDILDISRLESGTMKFITEKTNISDLINDVSETMRPSADLKKIKIKTYVEDNLKELTIDSDRIKQVIINLINNALKFSENGTEINLSAKQYKDSILFEVQDFGRGIPKNKKEKIFETFYQIDSGMDRKFGGAGLGLAISRGMVISHGGKIWVESEGVKGRGSTIKFTLPLEPEKDMEGRFKEIDIFGLELRK